MTDTITESFCERCGMRYAFEQNARHGHGRIGRVRVLTRGIKNYVANDGMPMSEAMAAAAHDEARTGVSRQLDAFHRTFNFCMSCRQYTCESCWNGKVGECLSCAPDLSREVLPAPFPDLPPGGPAHSDGLVPDDQDGELAAWPTADLDRATAGVGPTAMGAAAYGPLDDRPEEPETPSPPKDGMTTASAVPDEELTPAELAAIESALAAGHPVPGLPAASVDMPEAPAAAEPPPVAVEVAATPAVEPDLAVAPAPEHEPAAISPTAAVADTAVAALAAVTPGVGIEVVAGAQPAPAEPQPVVPLPSEPAERASAAQQQTRSLLRRFRPAHRPASDAAATAVAATAAIKRDEGTFATVEPEAAAATVDVVPDAVEADVSRVAAEVVAGAPEPVPGQAAAAESELTAQPPDELAAPPADDAAPADSIEQPTWRVMAPEGSPAPGSAWPDAPAWPTQQPGAPQAGPLPGSAAAPWASRLATARPEPTNVWAASSQEVLAALGPSTATRPGIPAVQACVSCGLSLSANARFCRRCGSRQG